MELNEVIINLKSYSESVYDKNVVLGGSVALKKHGLKLPFPPGDFDIIVYSPSKKQLEFIHDNFLDDSEYDEIEDEDNKCRSFNQCDKSGKSINILIEYNKKVPDNLLFDSEFNLPVNSIENIIEAKISYSRSKDNEQIIQLKELNFPINKKNISEDSLW